MAKRPTPHQGPSPTVDPSVLRALRRELAGERETARRLQTELAREAEFARKAAEQTLEARAQREEYRRVLAAAVANERRADTDHARIREELERIAQDVREAEHARGEAEGRAVELERTLQAEREGRRHELQEAHDRAWADAEARGRELQRLQHERGVALGQVRELLGRVPAHAPPSARLAAARARLSLAAAAFCLVLFLVFLVPFLLVVFAGSETTWPAMATGLSPWGLFALELALLVGALGLGSFGLRDLRGVEAATRKSNDDQGQDASESARVTSAV